MSGKKKQSLKDSLALRKCRTLENGEAVEEFVSENISFYKESDRKGNLFREKSLL